VPYLWIKWLHIASALAFVAIHGASVTVLYALRGERDRQRLLAALDFSARTAAAMYLSLIAVVGSGIWLGLTRRPFLSEPWFWSSLGILAVTTGLMVALAKPFTARLRAACEIRPSGVPRKSDAEIASILRSGRVHLITAIGVGALGLLLYLMIFQPPLWSTPASPVTTTAPGQDALLARGRAIFEARAGGVGCIVCHGPDGLGTAAAPAIAGKTRADIERALDEVPQMRIVELTESEVEAVAAYVATLP
jgi:mono/diheme cytochrome c family protein